MDNTVTTDMTTISSRSTKITILHLSSTNVNMKKLKYYQLGDPATASSKFEPSYFNPCTIQYKYLFAVGQKLYLRQVRWRSVSRLRRARHSCQGHQRGVVEADPGAHAERAGPVRAAGHAQPQPPDAHAATHLHADPVLEGEQQFRWVNDFGRRSDIFWI